MNKKELETELRPFYVALQQTFPLVKNIQIVPTYPGLEPPIYDVVISAPKMLDNDYSPAFYKAFDVLFANTTEKIRENIFNMCIVTDTIRRTNTPACCSNIKEMNDNYEMDEWA